MTRFAVPLSRRQATRIEAVGLLADEPVGLQRAWTAIEQMWTATDAQAHALPPAALETRVGGEWSYLETLRHLVFVTDAWLRDVILDKRQDYDPIGLPPDFVTNGAELGLDLSATPTATEVMTSRARAINAMHDYLASVADEDLDRPCLKFDGQFTVLGAAQVVIFEEWAHHVYATRDLSTVQASKTGE